MNMCNVVYIKKILCINYSFFAYFLFILLFLTQCSSKPCIPEGFVKNRNSQMIEVYKPDETKQCGMGKEIVLESMEKEFNDVGVEVLGRRKDQDNLFRITVCGTPTGKINVYRIYASDFKKAEKLSFKLLVKKQN